MITKTQRYKFLLPLLALPAALHAADVNVTMDITSPTTWTATDTYIIDKTIFVKNNTTLTINPGTLILGKRGPGLDTILGNADDTYGSIVVTRGAKIMAEGTAANPIVMTAIEERDGIAGDPLTKPQPELGDGGFWGGLILLGNAPINNYVSGTNANQKSIEGFPAGSAADIQYGGNDPADNSGVVKYVSIRFGGYEYQPNSEINGLTMGGVGSGTTIDSVEIVSNKDDGVEIFGGTVRTKRIAVAFCQDDSFDMDEGHQGHHQFWFSIQNANPDANQGDRGGEWDGGFGSTTSGTPYTNVRVYNATILGNGPGVGGGTSANNGFFITDNFSGQLHNSAIHDFGGQAITNGTLGAGAPAVPLPGFFNNTWGTFTGGAGANFATYATVGNGNSAVGTNLMIGNISRVPNAALNGALDPLPKAGSPLLTAPRSAFPGDAPVGFYETANYRGAFGGTNWMTGWTYLSRKGYLAAPTVQELQGPNQLVFQASASPNTVDLVVPVEKSDDLGVWTPAGNLLLNIPTTPGREFYRLDLSGN